MVDGYLLPYQSLSVHPQKKVWGGAGGRRYGGGGYQLQDFTRTLHTHTHTNTHTHTHTVHIHTNKYINTLLRHTKITAGKNYP